MPCTKSMIFFVFLLHNPWLGQTEKDSPYVSLNMLKNSGIYKITNARKEYENYLRKQENLNQNLNLRHITAPLRHGCPFTIVTIYNINIGLQDSPIIIRKLEPIVWIMEPEEVLWIAKLTQAKNTSRDVNWLTSLQTSKPELQRKSCLYKFCLQLNFLKISAKSRPWSRQLRVVMFPPETLLIKQQKCWYHSKNNKNQFMPTFPKVYNVVISSETQSLEKILQKSLANINIEDSIWSDFYSYEVRHEIVIWIKIPLVPTSHPKYYIVVKFNGYVPLAPIIQLKYDTGNNQSISAEHILAITPVSKQFAIKPLYKEKCATICYISLE